MNQVRLNYHRQCSEQERSITSEAPHRTETATAQITQSLPQPS